MPYVYAVTEAPAAPPPELYAISRGGLAAIVADHDAAAEQPVEQVDEAVVALHRAASIERLTKL